MISVLITLWGVFLLFVIMAMLYSINKKNCQSHIFENWEVVDIPYICIDVQGHQLNMIVDSGAAVSLITESALEMLNFIKSDRQVSLETVSNESMPTGTFTIPFTINGREIQEDFVAHPTDDFANFNKIYGITIHGLLGNSVFDKTKCKIDYKTHSVTFY